MNFIGTGKRLAAGDVGEAARSVGIETAVLLAFMEVEAAGRGFDNRNRPKMLRETHIFYRELGAGAKRDQAARAGLATSKWTRNYKSDSYPDLAQMIAIDQDAALRSCSFGLGQIMGFNCRAAGHADALGLVKTAMQGEREQLMQMVTLMKAWGMVPILTGRDFTTADAWRPAARKWNGAGYASNNYHTKMAAAYRKHKAAGPIGAPLPKDEISLLVRGMKGEAVRNLQNDLASLGYVFALGIDGRFGRETEDLVKSFQLEHHLKIDGKVGTATFAAIAAALKARPTLREPVTPEFDKEQTGWLATLVALILKLFGKG